MLDNSESDFWAPSGVRQRRREFTTGTYPADGAERTRSGGVILAIIASFSAVLVIAGLIYATGHNGRSQAALLAAGCEPTLYESRIPCITRQMVVSQYNAIVTPASKQLNADAAAYHADERHNLVAAELALTAEVATEQALDNNLAAATFTPQNRARSITLMTNAASFGNPVPLAAITFTPQATVIADALIRDIHAAAKLTAEQSRSSSLAQLRSFNRRVNQATVAAQTELKDLRTAVNIRP
jgi:hypothetical protein